MKNGTEHETEDGERAVSCRQGPSCSGDARGSIVAKGTAPHGGGQFRLLSQSLDRTVDSAYPCFSRSSPCSPFQATRIFYGRSCVRVPARGLPPPLAGEARASLLVPSSAFHLTRRGRAQRAPPSAEAPLPSRLPRLSSRLHSLVGWRASASACASLA